jgi:hypothetical protein
LLYDQKRKYNDHIPIRFIPPPSKSYYFVLQLIFDTSAQAIFLPRKLFSRLLLRRHIKYSPVYGRLKRDGIDSHGTALNGPDAGHLGSGRFRFTTMLRVEICAGLMDSATSAVPAPAIVAVMAIVRIYGRRQLVSC